MTTPRPALSHAELARLREMPMGKLTSALIDGLAPVIRTYIKAEIEKATAPLLDLIGELEAKVGGRNVKDL